MPHRSMTLKELAQMLGADARRLERMAQRGEIPCQKVGAQLRFNRAEVTDWLQQNMGAMDSSHLAEVDAGITADRQTQKDEAIIAPLLRIEAITPKLGARTKNSTLRDLVALAKKTGLVYDGEALLEAILEREEMCSTAMGGGIAIPHPRHPLPYAIAEPILVVARTSQGIVFGGADGLLANLFFLTASQDDRHHVHVLARLCRMLHDGTLISQMNNALTAQEMMDLMKQQETRILLQSS
jgi:PTS system nitrogen regulatory IIA component